MGLGRSCGLVFLLVSCLLLISLFPVVTTAKFLANSVESQGRTLEELEWVYQQPNPVKASKSLDKVVVQEDGTVTEKIEVDA